MSPELIALLRRVRELGWPVLVAAIAVAVVLAGVGDAKRELLAEVARLRLEVLAASAKRDARTSHVEERVAHVEERLATVTPAPKR